MGSKKGDKSLQEEVLFDGAEPVVGEPLTEKDIIIGEESSVEYYLFNDIAFYDNIGAPSVVSGAINKESISSKADVLRFLRKANPGKYILVKVVDELEVETPKEENIVRSNPRQKKPRTKEA